MISPTEAFIPQFGLAEWDFKKTFFSSVHHIRDSPFIPKSAIYFDFDRFSKTNFKYLILEFLLQDLYRQLSSRSPVFN